MGYQMNTNSLMQTMKNHDQPMLDCCQHAQKQTMFLNHHIMVMWQITDVTFIICSVSHQWNAPEWIYARSTCKISWRHRRLFYGRFPFPTFQTIFCLYPFSVWFLRYTLYGVPCICIYVYVCVYIYTWEGGHRKPTPIMKPPRTPNCLTFSIDILQL